MTTTKEPRGHKTSVGGHDYVLHIADGVRTLCGRPADRVNCDAGTATDEELCRVCLSKRQERQEAVIAHRSYETHAVLAGAYRGKRLSLRTTLTHTVLVENGRFVKVLCGTVDLDSIADCDADDPNAPPTCPRCAKKDPR